MSELIDLETLNFDLSDIETNEKDYTDGWREVVITEVIAEANKKTPSAFNVWLYLYSPLWSKEKRQILYINPNKPQHMHIAIAKLAIILSNHFKKPQAEVVAMLKQKELTVGKALTLLKGLSLKMWCENQLGQDGKMWLDPTDTILEYGQVEFIPRKKEKEILKQSTPDIPF